jgi:hypothetical protein
LFTANLMLKKKALQGAAPGELSRFERGPLVQCPRFFYTDLDTLICKIQQTTCSG